MAPAPHYTHTFHAFLVSSRIQELLRGSVGIDTKIWRLASYCNVMCVYAKHRDEVVVNLNLRPVVDLKSSTCMCDENIKAVPWSSRTFMYAPSKCEVRLPNPTHFEVTDKPPPNCTSIGRYEMANHYNGQKF